MCLLSGWSLFSSFSKTYISSSVNSCFPSFSMHLITSSNQPFADISFSSRKNKVFCHSASTFTFGSIWWFRIKNIFPACGTFCKRIFEPIQPARRAFAASGLREPILPARLSVRDSFLSFAFSVCLSSRRRPRTKFLHCMCASRQNKRDAGQTISTTIDRPWS